MDERTTEPDPGGQRGDWGVRLSEDDFYRAMASTQRRRVLYILLVQDAATLDNLTTVLAGWEATEAGMMRGADDYRRVRTELHHRDLPVLEDAGLVEYDQATDSITLRPLSDDVASLIARSVEGEQRGD